MGVTARFAELGPMSGAWSLVTAVAIGMAFGWCLERAGLGSARKLTGQFYLTDLTVFKVMFSAILTAMLGLFWLGRLGAIDLARIYVPETYVIPQMVGGLIFGAGFVIAGLCPGTSCVAAATGRTDGLFTMMGLFTGVLATGFVLPYVPELYVSTARGALTLPSALHVPYGVVVAGIVAVALAGFALAERIETSGREMRGGRALAGVALALGALACIAGSPSAKSATLATTSIDIRPHDAAEVSALELATWIRDRRQDVRVIDLRSAESFDEYHLPTAERVPLESIGSAFFRPGQTVVFYAEDEDVAAAARTRARGGANIRALALRGGVSAWVEQIMTPTRTPNATPEQAAAFDKVAEISRYFGGVPQVQSNVSRPDGRATRQTSSRADADPPSPSPSPDNRTLAVVRRRGC
jgi:rhodanese-related sulfurtransferase/uncharacterized membrane protein YedE/YeeE